MDHYRTVDAWVRSWEVPQEGDSGLAFASVTLRLDGRVIGRGQSVGDRPLLAAARGAVARARAVLRDGRDLEPSEREWDEIADRVLVSLEISDSLGAVTDEELRALTPRVSPGVHALIATLGDRTEIMSPDELFTIGLWGERALLSLVSELTGNGSAVLWSGDEIVELGVRFRKARTVWVAQTGEGLGPVFLDRGGRVIDPRSVGPEGLSEMVSGLTSSLLAQRWAGSEPYGLAGTRDAVSGRSNPRVAPVHEQGLAALALVRASSRRASGEEDRRAWLAGALRVLLDLSEVSPGETAPWEDPVGSASVVLAIKEIEHAGAQVVPELASLETRCADSVRSAFEPGVGFGGAVPDAARSLVAWALVRLEDSSAGDAVRAVFTDTPVQELATQTPFLGWAALEHAGGGAIASRDALVAMRDALMGYQLGHADLDAWDRDLLGGIVFTRSSDPLPTSVNARPIALLCTMLGDPRLTPGTIGDESVRRELSRTGHALRFVRQLMIDPSSGFLCADPGLSLGGVREALWDWRVSPADTALALLCVLEFERSLRAISARQSGAP